MPCWMTIALHLLTKTDSGRTLESAGPIVWGFRLESSLTPDAWRAVTYEKGTWIIHMLRRRLGDEKFLALLREVSSHHHSISTEEFRDLASQYAPKSPDPDLKIFFDNWVYGTGVPAVKLSYAGAARNCPEALPSGMSTRPSPPMFPWKCRPETRANVYWLPTGSDPAAFSIAAEIAAHQSSPARRRLPDDNFEMRPHHPPMPVASKRRVEARKAAPIVAVEPEPQPEEIDLPPAIKVTALVFSYDSAPALRRCLAALEGSNDRASIEILVVDCGSHDESAQLDSEFSNVTMLRLPRYFGRTKALNIGTRTATGDYLLFMTPEVEVLPTTIPVAGGASGV